MLFSSCTSESFCSSCWGSRSSSSGTGQGGRGQTSSGGVWRISSLSRWSCYRRGLVSTARSPSSSPGFAFRLEKLATRVASSSTGSKASCTTRRHCGSLPSPTPCSASQWPGRGGVTRLRVAGRRKATPNPSLQPTRSGRQRKAGPRHSCYFREPALRCLPTRAAELER